MAGVLDAPPAPRFSVLVPCYNAAPFIRATLDSIRNQGHPSVEVVVMDGASTDGTLDILASYSGLNLVWHSAPDHGQLDAVQQAAALARGDILYWLNADDILLPGSLAAVDAVNGGLIRGLTMADHLLFYRQMYSECIFWRRGVTRLLPDSDHDLRICTDYAFFLNLRRGRRHRWLDKRLGAFRMVAGQASERYADRHAAEFARIRTRGHGEMGWSEGSIPWRRALHWPAFTLRQGLIPAIHAGARALRRLADGGAKRRAMTDAFFDQWLTGETVQSPELVRLLWR
jgi:glycosyltransferase involved in cell wall biosynthesis